MTLINLAIVAMKVHLFQCGVAFSFSNKRQEQAII